MLCLIPRCADGSGQPRDAGHGRWACGPCVEATRRRLRAVEQYSYILPLMLAPGRSADDRHSPGYGSRLPARADVLVALDPRSRPTATGEDDEVSPTWSILGTLHGLAQQLRQEQDVTSPRSQPTVTREVGYLLGAVDWAAHRPSVAAPFADIATVHTQCRRLAGDQPPRSIGRCPTLLPTGECWTPLYMPTTGDSVVCHNPACGREWTRPHWERLARLITDNARGAA